MDWMPKRRLMDAAAVNPLLDEMRRETKSRDARIGMAELALKFANLTPCGRKAWEDFLTEQKGA